MSVLFMQGVSSQRELILAAKSIFATHNPKGDKNHFLVLASHSENRPEILSTADRSFIEPIDVEDKKELIATFIEKHNIKIIHAGSKGKSLIHLVDYYESLGARLICGAGKIDDFVLADDKFLFTQLMQANDLPVVPAKLITDAQQLKMAIELNHFGDNMPLCIKPVKGIYGLGFWRLRNDTPRNTHLINPGINTIHPEAYISGMSEADKFEPQILMPYYNGDETSVDMVVDKGNTIFAIARIKSGKYQKLSLHNKAIDLAVKVAKLVNAHGIINVQTINDPKGEPLLLEANLRPSGGVCFSKHSNINIAEIFMDYFYFGATANEVQEKYIPRFNGVTLKVDSHALYF